MASQQSTVDFILEQIQGIGTVTAKKMFGEYALYCNEKVIALICDDQLFVKPTQSGKEFIGNFIEAPPYPGAKPYLLITGDLWEDPDWLSELIKISLPELPLPKKKSAPSKKL
ncbi:TfoX/Sxy family protein [Legionella fallonii]|uniref:TfoX domain-containing protein n=1 Tax=Legionella fallonii LLAP-10 TaxID=1212491 RepID=A0A098G6W3_9GAMM|nr:TfoX/Sxy family protein [Legionella fallonii]CEG57724.1 TfoX domain-containing protein [Legionella fallonii LLAP-10]